MLAEDGAQIGGNRGNLKRIQRSVLCHEARGGSALDCE